jgi:Uma2 family endonuclease
MHAAHHAFTVADYLRLERDTRTKHEFLGGHVWAMSGGSREHALYSANVVALLAGALRKKKCAVHSSDLRIGVKEAGLFTYADAAVVCGRVETDPSDPSGHTVTNPRVLVEVLSPSTEDYDRGEKLGHYKKIPALQEVVFIAHDRREVEVVRREADGSWSRHVAASDDDVSLESIACTVSVADIYRDPLARPKPRRGRARR